MPFGDFLVLDKIPKERNPGVPGWAAQLGPGVPGLSLPSYSPELELIERPWKVTKRRPVRSLPPDLPGPSNRHPSRAQTLPRWLLPHRPPNCQTKGRRGPDLDERPLY